MANHSPRTSAQNPFRNDALKARSAQLSSLLVLLYGGGRDSFNALFEDDRDNILWLASDLARQIDEGLNGEGDER